MFVLFDNIKRARQHDDASKRITKEPVARRGERWLPIDGMGGKYRVSSLGRVYNTERRRFLHPKAGTYDHACRLYLYHHGEQRRMILAHLVATLFNGSVPQRRCVIVHKDGDRNNCAAANLMWRSYSEVQSAPKHNVYFDVGLFNKVMGIGVSAS